MTEILIIGVGSEYRSDDAVGLEAVRRLRECIPVGVETREATGEGTTLIETWADADCVFVIDAMEPGDQPGRIVRIDISEEQPPARFRCSTHDFGVAEAIETARVLDRLPKRLILYGIEGQNFTQGVGLSADVEAAVPKVIERVRGEVDGLP